MSPEISLEEIEDMIDERVEQAVEEETRELREEVEQLRDRVDELEHQQQINNSRLDGMSNNVDRLQDRLEDGDLAGAVETNADPTVERETPLEDVVALPESVAEDHLSPNQQRARFLASDIRDYGDSVPRGRRLTAGRIGKILRAGLDVDPHPETVRRVMQILDDLAGDEATRRKKNGEKRIVLHGGLVDRLERLSRIDVAHTDMSRVTG